MKKVKVWLANKMLSLTTWANSQAGWYWRAKWLEIDREKALQLRKESQKFPFKYYQNGLVMFVRKSDSLRENERGLPYEILLRLDERRFQALHESIESFEYLFMRFNGQHPRSYTETEGIRLAKLKPLWDNFK